VTEHTSHPIASHHVLDAFDCGNEHLNTWLTRRAWRNEGKYSRTFVVADNAHRVIGFYGLSAGSVGRGELVKAMQRNAPELVPVIILGRFAVEGAYQRHGLGKSLLLDALERSFGASLRVGAMAVMLHAKNEPVRDYYGRFGFQALVPSEPLTLMLPMATIAEMFEAE
jgi:GNAT superfamily N-acetyltransferase